MLWQGIELLIMIRVRAEGAQVRVGGGSESLDGAPGIFSRNRVIAEGGIGFSVGLLGGAVGLILGSIRLPALIRILRIDPRIAAGTNLFIGFIMGSVGWIGHVVKGEVDYALLVMMGAAAMVGSFYGAKLTGRVRLDTLILTMGWVLLVVGVLLIAQAYRRL